MLNVLVLVALLFGLLGALPRTTQADHLCALGWICEQATDLRFQGSVVINGELIPVCNLIQVMRTKHLNLELTVVTTAQRVERTIDLVFILALAQSSADGTRTQILLREARLFSADRVIDTKAWTKTIPQNTPMIALHVKNLELVDPISITAEKIAAGARYGALIETHAGQRMKFEIEVGRPSESDKEAIRSFRNCIAHGQIPAPIPVLPDTDRG